MSQEVDPYAIYWSSNEDLLNESGYVADGGWSHGSLVQKIDALTSQLNRITLNQQVKLELEHLRSEINELRRKNEELEKALIDRILTNQ